MSTHLRDVGAGPGWTEDQCRWRGHRELQLHSPTESDENGGGERKGSWDEGGWVRAGGRWGNGESMS